MLKKIGMSLLTLVMVGGPLMTCCLKDAVAAVKAPAVSSVKAHACCPAPASSSTPAQERNYKTCHCPQLVAENGSSVFRAPTLPWKGFLAFSFLFLEHDTVRHDRILVTVLAFISGPSGPFTQYSPPVYLLNRTFRL